MRSVRPRPSREPKRATPKRGPGVWGGIPALCFALQPVETGPGCREAIFSSCESMLESLTRAAMVTDRAGRNARVAKLTRMLGWFETTPSDYGTSSLALDVTDTIVT